MVAILCSPSLESSPILPSFRSSVFLHICLCLKSMTSRLGSFLEHGGKCFSLHTGNSGPQVLKSINTSGSPDRKGAKSILPPPSLHTLGLGFWRDWWLYYISCILSTSTSGRVRLRPGLFSRSPRSQNVRWVKAKIGFPSHSLVLLSPYNFFIFHISLGL